MNIKTKHFGLIRAIVMYFVGFFFYVKRFTFNLRIIFQHCCLTPSPASHTLQPCSKKNTSAGRPSSFRNRKTHFEGSLTFFNSSFLRLLCACYKYCYGKRRFSGWWVAHSSYKIMVLYILRP